MVPVLCLGYTICIHKKYNGIFILDDPRLLNMLAAKFIIICITHINSCVFFEMYTNKCEGPMYYQKYELNTYFVARFVFWI